MPTNEGEEMLECLKCKKTFLYTAKKVSLDTDDVSFEYRVCPFRKSFELAEVVEPIEEIDSVKSVDLAEVDEFLKNGYSVRELYSKTATLVKVKK